MDTHQKIRGAFSYSFFPWILFSTPLLFLLFARLALNFNGLYGQDAHRYFQYLQELQMYFQSGEIPGEFHWPVLYPLSGLFLKIIFPVSGDFALQLISALALSVSALFSYRIILHINNKSQSFEGLMAILLFLVFCPQLAISSILNMSDMYGMMWVVLCWHSYYKFKDSAKLKNALLLSLFAALATFSRYPALLLVVAPLLHGFIRLLLSKNRGYTPLFVLLFLLAAAPEFLLHNTYKSVGDSYLLNHWSLAHLFTANFNTIDGAQQYPFINLLYITYPIWHPAYFLVGGLVFLLLFLKKGRKRLSMLLLVSIVGYLLFLGGIPFQNRRFFIPVFPLIIILLFPMVLERISIRHFTRYAMLPIVVAQLAISWYYFRNYLYINRFEHTLVHSLRTYEGKDIYIFYWDIALKSYDVDMKYYNLWEREYEHFGKGDLVLFNPEMILGQWEGTAVMNNWEKLTTTNKLVEIERWPNEWKLYEIR